MAEIKAPIQGVLDISNVQGNYIEIPMVFKTGSGAAIDLTTYEGIRMEIKEVYEVNAPAFRVLQVGSGLTISGTGNNILTFVLSEEFWNTPIQNWVYDITFEIDNKKFTYIKGQITNVKTASRL
jgi:3D (Asp-Asp-Asp) domain-containing protein